MAIRSLIDNGLHFSETIPISFTSLAAPFNFTFTRDGNRVSITIPKINFGVSIAESLKSTTQIPERYIPNSTTMNWIIIDGNNYVSCNISIDHTGIITIFNGVSGTLFQPGIGYSTMNNQTLSYLV